MATIDEATLAEWERLISKATPGPWQFDYDGDRYSISAGAAEIAGVNDDEGGIDDTELIVAAVNALPALLAAYREQAAELAQQRQDFRRLDDYTHSRMLWIEHERDAARAQLAATRAALAETVAALRVHVPEHRRNCAGVSTGWLRPCNCDIAGVQRKQQAALDRIKEM